MRRAIGLICFGSFLLTFGGWPAVWCFMLGAVTCFLDPHEGVDFLRYKRRKEAA